MRHLQRVRESLGLSRAEMSRRTRIQPTTYGRIERGDENPYPVWRWRIEQAVRKAGGSVDGLFEIEASHDDRPDAGALPESIRDVSEAAPHARD